jgi:hypothetical protein
MTSSKIVRYIVIPQTQTLSLSHSLGEPPSSADIVVLETGGEGKKGRTGQIFADCGEYATNRRG